MKRLAALVLLIAGLVAVAAPAQAKLVNKPACAEKSLPLGLHLQVGYCTK